MHTLEESVQAGGAANAPESGNLPVSHKAFTRIASDPEMLPPASS